MNQKINRNEKQVLKRKQLALGEDKNPSALINIAQEDDSNSFELSQNLWIHLFFINNQKFKQ